MDSFAGASFGIWTISHPHRITREISGEKCITQQVAIPTSGGYIHLCISAQKALVKHTVRLRDNSLFQIE